MELSGRDPRLMQSRRIVSSFKAFSVFSCLSGRPISASQQTQAAHYKQPTMTWREEENRKEGVVAKPTRPRRVKGSVRADGCVLPSKCPRQTEEGFQRPAGRKPVGLEWDSTQGIWAPAGLNIAAAEAQVGVQQSAVAASDGVFDAILPSNKDIIETYRDEMKELHQQKSRSPRKQKLIVSRRSLYREPYRNDDNLTLYDRHRRPRPVVSGRVTCPQAPVLEAFRCVICLNMLRRTRVVVDCLHRFCEECIERCLRLGQKSQCPICRIAIPTRRNLAPDTKLDELLTTVLGPNFVEDAAVARGHKDQAVSIQKAIHRKHEQQQQQQQQDERRRQAAVAHSEEQGQHDGDEQQSSEVVKDRLQLLLDPADSTDLAVYRHAQEHELPDLELPHLRVPRYTTVAQVKTFLCQKLPANRTRFQLLGQRRCSRSQKKRTVFLTDWMTVASIAQNFGCMELYYQYDQPAAREL